MGEGTAGRWDQEADWPGPPPCRVRRGDSASGEELKPAGPRPAGGHRTHSNPPKGALQSRGHGREGRGAGEAGRGVFAVTLPSGRPETE